MSLQDFIISNIWLVPKDKNITKEWHHSHNPIDQNVQRHPDQSDLWKPMLNAPIQESRRHKRSCLVAQDRNQSNDRLESKADPRSGKHKKCIQQAAHKRDKRI